MRTAAEIGRANQIAGENFESWIDTQHDKAKLLGILAHVVHNQAESKMVGGRLTYSAAGVADYTGVLERGAKCAAIEAKSTVAVRFARSRVEAEQQKHLEIVARAGGLALLVIEFTSSNRARFAIPWLEVPWEVKRTAQSVTAAALEKWAIDRDPGSCYLLRFHAGGPRSAPVELQRRRFYARS